MPDLETTQAKLRSTPTAGVSGEHSAYYRRLLSAGYKGYIQGSIGGGTLYGAIGLAIGAVVGIPLMVITGGTLPLLLVPALGASLGMYGAHAFADIGKTAAIIADSADNNEKRRYLLDRYYETNNEQEAQEIKRQLEEVYEARKPAEAFHWRPALVGAMIGITLAVVTVALAPYFAPHLLPEILGFVGLGGAAHGATATLALGAPMVMAVGAAIGGLAGSIIGIDREYIRGWLDKAEFTVHEEHHSTREIAARERDIELLTQAANRGDSLALRTMAAAPAAPVETLPITRTPTVPATLEARPAPIDARTIAGLRDTPDTVVSNAVAADRIAGMQHVPNV